MRLRTVLARGRVAAKSGHIRPASATSDNKAFLGEPQFSEMQPGTIFVLLSRAAVVDFDALVRAAQAQHIRVATDVFPEEPLPQQHPARRTKNLLLSAHKAGALEQTLKRVASIVVADTELICKGLPPVLCKVAQPETVGMFHGKPVAKSLLFKSAEYPLLRDAILCEQRFTIARRDKDFLA